MVYGTMNTYDGIQDHVYYGLRNHVYVIVYKTIHTIVYNTMCMYYGIRNHMYVMITYEIIRSCMVYEPCVYTMVNGTMYT